MTATAVVLMLWAPLASWGLLAAGAALFLVAVTCWINELRHERQPS